MPVPKKPRPIRIAGDVAFVTLTQGYEAVIDVADVALVDRWSWTALVSRRANGATKVYAYRATKGTTGRVSIMMHRVIAATPDDLFTDHIDGDGLNNRKANLRHATAGENQRNSRKHANSASGVKGVFWHNGTQKWRVQITMDWKAHYLGLFNCKTAAALAYAKASKAMHGNFGRLK